MNKLMKFGFAALAVVFSIASCSETTAQSKEVSQEVVKSSEMSMSIEGMTCAMGCARAIEVELNNLAGVDAATVNFEDAKATLTYNTALTSETAIVDFVNNYRKGAFKASVLAATKCGAECTKPCCAKAKTSCCASKKKACSPEQKAKCEAEKKSCDKASKEGKSCCASKKKACSPEQKAKCEAEKKSCSEKAKCDKSSKKSCSDADKAKCDKSSKKSCCASKKVEKSCGADCTKPCCAKADAKACGTECAKPCCAK